MAKLTLTAAIATTVARNAASGITRQFPVKPGTVLVGRDDVRDARNHTPIFYGCFDWHSSVHSHWALVRLLRLSPDAQWAPNAARLLSNAFTPAHVAAEVEHLTRPQHRSFEMPYGIAWLLALCGELRRLACTMNEAAVWRERMSPLEQTASRRFGSWLEQLPFPIRSGQHGQSAFAMSLALRWAELSSDSATDSLIRERAREFYLSDRDAPLSYEPSAYDFLSPSLSEAALLSETLPEGEFTSWLAGFMPSLPALSLTPVVTADPSHAKLAHFAGLNASRAWMLHQIAIAIPVGTATAASLHTSSHDHGSAAVAALSHDDYAVTHWVGSFVLYYLTC